MTWIDQVCGLAWLGAIAKDIKQYTIHSWHMLPCGGHWDEAVKVELWVSESAARWDWRKYTSGELREGGGMFMLFEGESETQTLNFSWFRSVRLLLVSSQAKDFCCFLFLFFGKGCNSTISAPHTNQSS